ncbi:MAG: type II toxin-antitoxin system VapC family toxin [Pseudolysinimonas sp.]|uniref:type II toxin-antitoxin system VapC family toxin n=1 Tax=Pseudolysinimonas sp. TaxID=2680009 RepID=UPI00326433C2
MTARVVDASVVVATIRDGARPMLDPGTRMMVPHLLDVEVASALRRLVRGAAVAPDDARSALVRLATLPGIVRHPHTSLIGRAWELRDNFSAYDAVYVALAERLKIPLVTLDGRLARAAADYCDVELVE